jgi:hypothetical protein
MPLIDSSRPPGIGSLPDSWMIRASTSRLETSREGVA